MIAVRPFALPHFEKIYSPSLLPIKLVGYNNKHNKMTGNETNPLIEAKMKPHKSASKIKAIKLALDDSIVNLDANA